MASIPKHIVKRYGSKRAFKSKKRQALKKLQKALKDLRTGCAFLPADGLAKVHEIQELADSIEKRISIKEWGR